MNVTSASCCQHTHSFKHIHTHTLGQTNAGESTHSCFILAASTKGGSLPKHGERGGGTFRVVSQSAPGLAQTFFRVTHARDSIDARVGGACVLNINQNDSGAHVGLLLDEKC